jgi:hypothetical protein
MRKVDKQIQERKKKWLEYLQMTPSGRYPRQLTFYQSTGRRDPGAPRRRWFRYPTTDLTNSLILGDDYDDKDGGGDGDSK